MAISLVELLVQGIPELIGATALCFALAGAGLRWRWIIPVGIAQGVTIYLVRLLPVAFGLHGVIMCLLFVVYLRLLVGTPVLRGFCSAFLTMAILIIFEYMSNSLLFVATGLSFEEVRRNSLLWALFGWPQVVLLFVSAFFVNRLRRRQRLPKPGRYGA